MICRSGEGAGKGSSLRQYSSVCSHSHECRSKVKLETRESETRTETLNVAKRVFWVAVY
jgi:hypothetical protein